jgi:dTDP-4-dehydrorhamnose reductase
MRILLTGVTGQVGGALAPKLAAIGEVVAADRTMLDLSDPTSVLAALDRLAPDLIVNPAAYTAVDRAEDEPDLAFAVNGRSPGEMAAWAARRGVPLLHFSTDYVFDGSGTKPWREDDPTGPLSVYGASKLAGEEAVRAAGGTHLIVRTCWVYDARGKNFLRTIARLAEERTELRIVDDQVGAPTSATLIADGVMTLLADGRGSAAAWAEAGSIVHLSASGETSWFGFAQAIVDGLRRRGRLLKVETIVPITTADFPTKARRPANSRFDLQRAQTLGISLASWSAILDNELDAVARTGV